MGFAGAVSINMLAVIEVMRLKNVSDMESCLEKVKRASEQVIAIRREKK